MPTEYIVRFPGSGNLKALFARTHDYNPQNVFLMHYKENLFDLHGLQGMMLSEERVVNLPPGIYTFIAFYHIIEEDRRILQACRCLDGLLSNRRNSSNLLSGIPPKQRYTFHQKDLPRLDEWTLCAEKGPRAPDGSYPEECKFAICGKCRDFHHRWLCSW